MPESLAVLSASEYLALAATCDSLFPRDESPGAIDLGVPIYIDGALGAPDSHRWTPGLLDGLARIDEESNRRARVPLWRMGDAAREALIAEWAADSRDENRLFVRNALAATLEGAFGDPVYKGNLGAKGWSSFGVRVDPFSPSRVQ